MGYQMRHVLQIPIAIVGLILASFSSVQAENQARINGTADYAFINGKIYTMDKKRPWAEAVTIEGNKITYVGDASGLKYHIGIGTEVIDLDGKMLMPGFVDGHVHAAAGGMILKGVDMQADDKDEIFKRLKDYVTANPNLDVIVGWGVRFNPWTDGNPTAAMLDAIESKRPV
ncbi:MAG: amidohydrolase family protein, partial [Alphaproteobacteria bacterium]